MARADLHVHSMYSERPANWFLQRIGASESYTRPEAIYRTALARGMDFVTVTDHNRMDAALMLKEAYPDKVFTGVETTTYFPENGCKIHILLYGLTEGEFAEVQKIRADIYQLRGFIQEKNLAHSVAHATYAINGRLSLDILEKLMLLFNVFEGINGARGMAANTTWTQTLRTLDRERLERLEKKHGIRPMGEKPWIKGLTGGSDDHAGLFIAKACTHARAHSPEAFLEDLRERRIRPEGRHNDAKSLAFALYKIAYDFSLTRGAPLRRSALARLGDALLAPRGSQENPERQPQTAGEGNQIRLLLAALAEEPAPDAAGPHTDLWLAKVYEKITTVSDAFFKNILFSMLTDIREGNLDRCVRDIASLLPGIFLSIPFFMTLRHMQDGRALLRDLKQRFLGREDTEKKILWFTDTFQEMNGVAATLREITQRAAIQGLPIRVVTTLDAQNPDLCTETSGALIALPSLFHFPLPHYETLDIRMPSLLTAIEALGGSEVDAICISTPGPVGLLGLLLSRLLDVPCTAIYHTDFTAQALAITGNESLADIVESSVRLFYSFADEILVPSTAYMDILEKRGFDRSRMRLFLRAVDVERFAPSAGHRRRLEAICGVRASKILLYAGRISEDKGIRQVLHLHRLLGEAGHPVHLILAGDGPDLAAIREETAGNALIRCAGRIPREDLPVFYSAASLMLFPSTTDTFGMVVLEAQACGLPVFVSDAGGPGEIVLDGETGRVLPAGDTGAWSEALVDFIITMDTQPLKHAAMRAAARKRGLQFSWDKALSGLFGDRRHPDEKEKNKPAA